MFGSNGLLSDDKRSSIVFEENGRIYRAQNKQGRRVLRHQVDGGVISGGPGGRCDNALTVYEMPSDKIGLVYLIELKGKDLKRGAEQISDTIRALRPMLAGCCVNARIVLSRVQVPDIRTTPVIKCERDVEAYGGNLIYKANLLEESI